LRRWWLRAIVLGRRAIQAIGRWAVPTGDGEQFVGEAMTPVAGTGDVAAMTRREPGLPAGFTWQGRPYRIAGVIRQWKSNGPCRSGGGEMYLRRHWYKILTDPGMIMTIYCDRQAGRGRSPKARWWIYTVQPVSSEG
jgi:hypothetical protein